MLQELITMEKKLQKNISCILQFIQSARFMASSFSNIINSFPERIYRFRFKFGPDHNKCEKYCECFLEYTNFKDDLIEYKCLCCNKNQQHKFDEKLKELFFNTCKFSNLDKNKFILLLQKGVYPCEYKDRWEKLNETSI